MFLKSCIGSQTESILKANLEAKKFFDFGRYGCYTSDEVFFTRMFQKCLLVEPDNVKFQIEYAYGLYRFSKYNQAISTLNVLKSITNYDNSLWDGEKNKVEGLLSLIHHDLGDIETAQKYKKHDFKALSLVIQSNYIQFIYHFGKYLFKML